MPNHQKDSYTVGYGKPPAHHQFKPGRSGNPRGRPSGSKNLATDLKEVIAERVGVTEGGRVRKVSKQRASLLALAAKAMGGNVAAIKTLLGMIAVHMHGMQGEVEVAPLSQEDEAILAAFLERRGRPQGQKIPVKRRRKHGC